MARNNTEIGLLYLLHAGIKDVYYPAESCMAMQKELCNTVPISGAEPAGHGPPLVLSVPRHEACLCNNVRNPLGECSLCQG